MKKKTEIILKKIERETLLITIATIPVALLAWVWVIGLVLLILLFATIPIWLPVLLLLKLV